MKRILFLSLFLLYTAMSAWSQTTYTTNTITLDYKDCDESYITTNAETGIYVKAPKADNIACWQVGKYDPLQLVVPDGYVITAVKINYLNKSYLEALGISSSSINTCDNLALNAESNIWEQKGGTFSRITSIRFKSTEAPAYVKSVTVTYHKHTFTHNEGVDATCVATGKKESWTCSDCGRTYYDEAGANEVAKAEDLILPIDPTHHPEPLEENAGVDATCVKDGIAHYWHCNHCNQNFADENGEGSAIADVVIPKEQGIHLHLTYIAQMPATNTDIGYAMNHWHCLDCGKNFEDEACTKTITSEVIIPPLWTTPPYLCFMANTAGSTVQLNKHNEPYEVILEYSTDECISWTSVDFTQVTTTGTITLANVGDKVYFRHKGNEVAEGLGYNSNYYKFVMSGSIAASGNIMSLVDKMCELKAIPCRNCFAIMFNDCASLTSAPELPATTMTIGCYANMFQGCANLTSAPKLPATTLATNCYGYMFAGCTSLTTAPELPATTLATGCYSSMFSGCTSLATAPELPATTLTTDCYSSMFSGCTSLATAPELPATTLATWCYSNMFAGCEKLNKIKVGFAEWTPQNATTDWVAGVASKGDFVCPEGLRQIFGESNIPITNWSVNGVLNEISLCFTANMPGSSVQLNKEESGSKPAPVSLEYSNDGINWSAYSIGTEIVLANTDDKVYFRNSGDELATEFSSESGWYRFSMGGSIAASGNVMSLIDKSGLAKTLSAYCFYGLFSGCTSLTQAPELPATTLATGCYSNMFAGCTSLTEAPELPATTLVDGCYKEMFAGCEKLNKIKVEFAEWTPQDATTDWVAGVASKGDFVCPEGLRQIFGESNIPAHWITSRPQYLCFTANTAGSTIQLSKHDEAYEAKMEYSTDDCKSWTSVDFAQVTTTGIITLANVGDKVYFRRTEIDEANNNFLGNLHGYFNFVMSGSIAASGNIASLLSKNPDWNAASCVRCFAMLFRDCTSLTSAPKLPDKDLKPNCFANMFQGCTNLTSAPELQATLLTSGCYSNMFAGCTSLVTAPELPATTLKENCYSQMFAGCTSLVAAPELPDTTLAAGCYSNMFAGCTNLTEAPELPATTLATGCYSNMFAGCTNLTEAPALAATTLKENCYSQMFAGCTSLTQAPKLPATTLATGCYSQMFAGCTSLVTAPELPATTLAAECYSNMFAGCTSLTEAPALPATTLVNGCYKEMFAGCAKLNKIKVEFAEWTPQDATINWLKDVAYTGDFIGPNELSEVYGPSYIPGRWALNGVARPYLCFMANTAGSTVQLNKYYEAYDVVLEYSTDDCISWTSVDFTQVTTTGTITLANVGDKVYFRHEGKEVAEGLGYNSNYYQFEMSGSIAASGNIMSLVDKTCASKTIPCKNCFAMMFNGCTSLTSAPELPATTLTTMCYGNMFQGCTNLISAPELPATELTYGCYTCMFAGCTSLTTAPELPATTLSENSYYDMFEGCSQLNMVKVAFTEWMDNATGGWLIGVAETGTFVCPDALDKTQTGASYIPEGWTPVFEVKANNEPETENYYSTFYSSKNAYEVPEGVTAYTGVAKGDKLQLTPVADGIIPAGEAVILRTTQSTATDSQVTFALTATTTTATKCDDNMLQGSDESMTLPSISYALSLGQNGVGFYDFSGKELPAHKAYLTLAAASSVSLRFSFGDATDIDAPDIDDSIVIPAYNLQGQQVDDSYRGIVIINGKKYVVK